MLWRAETDWLPFLLLITILLFAQAGLYRHREARAGMGRIVASLTLVAVIALAFGVGIGHEFTTFGLAPTAVVPTTIFVALLRGSYEVVSGELLRRAGVRRRAVLVGSAAERARRCARSSAARAAASTTSSSASSPRTTTPDRLGGYADLGGVLDGATSTS